MIIGTVLFFTIILLPLGLLIGLVGFMMMVAGLVTSNKKVEPVIIRSGSAPAQQEVVIAQPGAVPQTFAQPGAPSQQPIGPTKYCKYCGARISADSKFCA